MLICFVLYRVFFDRAFVFILKSQKTFEVFIAYSVIKFHLTHIFFNSFRAPWQSWLRSYNFFGIFVAFIDFIINFLLFLVRLICFLDSDIEVHQKVPKYHDLAVHDEEDFYSCAEHVDILIFWHIDSQLAAAKDEYNSREADLGPCY